MERRALEVTILRGDPLYVALLALGKAGLGVPCARAMVRIGGSNARAVAAWMEE